MLLVRRALLVLGLATLSNATGRVQVGKVVKLILDPSVRPRTASMSASSIANMSLTPWTYRDSYDVSRLPQRISQAQCLTSGCLNLQGGGENEALEAKPIYYQVLVLHRVPRQQRTRKGGRKKRSRYDFRLGMEVIKVGCTCVRPSVVPQQ